MLEFSILTLALLLVQCKQAIEMLKQFYYLAYCYYSAASHLCIFLLADIQILMGSLVYLRHGIENSPYRSLLETNQWAEICNIFTRDACALLGLSVESPLSVRLEDHNQHLTSSLNAFSLYLYISIVVDTKPNILVHGVK